MTTEPINQEVIDNTLETENEKLGKITEFYGLNEQIRSVKAMKDSLHAQTDKMMNDDGIGALDEKVASMTVEQIEALTTEEVDAMYVSENGELEFTNLFKEKAREDEFKKEFLVFIKQQAINEEKIDIELARLEEETSKFEPEFEELLKEFNDLGLYLRNRMEDEMNNPETAPERRDRLVEMIAAFDDVYTLERIYDNVTKHSLKNVVNDYYNRDDVVYKKYLNVLKKLELKVDLTRFGQLEERFLEEKYNKYPNLFMFIVLKHYAYIKNVDKGVDGMFLSQLSVVLKSLYSNTLAEADKEKFLSGVRRTLDLFIQD